jgi:uncharacterized protein (TIGR00730 family)
MTEITALCVYCGAAVGNDPAHRAAAEALGAAMARRRIRLIYGGGRIGLMGVVADAVLGGGGQVTGVIPAHLQRREHGHREITELRVVSSMHERKRIMSEIADGFVVLPGGLGTLDETLEIVTWRQLGLHDKPVVIADVAGYWRPLLSLVDAVIAGGYARPDARKLFAVADSIEGVFAALDAAPAPRVAVDAERL